MKKFKIFWPILLIIIVWFAFANPFFIKGKIPFPSDYLVNNFSPWSAYPGFAGPVKNAATPDVITQIFPWKSLVIEAWKSGNLPLWNSYSFAGTPLLANYQSAALSPINKLFFIFPFYIAWSLQVLLAPLLAGVFTYIFLRSLKVSQVGSIISSISFMFCGFITTWMDYGTLSYAISFLPLALFSVEKFSQTKKWVFLVSLAVSVPLSFFSGHFQISIYYLLFTISYLLFKYFQTKDLRSSIQQLTSILFGLLLCGPQLLPSFELYSQAVRSSLFLKIEVIPWGYLSTFLAPDFLGNPVTRNDWFGHYAEWNAYIGLIPLVLALYSIIKRSPAVLFFAAVGFAAILLSFQSPIVDLLIAAKIPVLSTSAVGRVVVLFSFSFAVLAGFGFDSLYSDLLKRKIGAIIILVSGFGALLLLLWTLAARYVFIPVENSAVAVSNLKLPAIILASFVVALVVIFLSKNKKILIVFPVIVVLLVSFDMLRFSTKFVPFMSHSLIYPKVPISEFLQDIPKTDRVFGNFGAESYITFRMSGVDGYDPLFVSRYGELLNSAQDGLFHTPDRVGVNLAKDGKFTPVMIDLLGIKYFVNKKADGREPWAFPIHKYPTDQFKIVYQDEAYQVFENQRVFPRALVVGDYKVEQDNRKILKKMFEEGTDLKKMVVFEQDPNIKSTLATGSAKITSYKSNKIQIETESDSGAVLLLTDPYYPGWKATVNGLPAKILRADYALRAIVIPRGKSEVEFIYDPDSFKNGVILAIVGLVGLVGLAIYSSKKSASR